MRACCFARGRRAGLVHVARGPDNRCAAAEQTAGCLGAKTRRHASQQDSFAGEIDTGENVIYGRRETEG